MTAGFSGEQRKEAVDKETWRMAIRVLMVDVDGVVVVQSDPQGWSANLERDLGFSRDTLQAEFFATHFYDVVRGRARLRDRLGPVLLEHAPHLTCSRLIDYWFTQDAQLDMTLLAQLDCLRQRGLQLHLATVQEHERAEFLWQQLGLRDRFDAMHYAADIGWAKPAAEFFKAVEKRSGFSSEEIFFIDDKVENVEAARRCGWRAGVWTGSSTVEQLLRDERCSL